MFCNITSKQGKYYEDDTEGSCARLLPSTTCQKCEEKDITILELKQELAEEKNKLEDTMKKIEKIKNTNKGQNRFSI